MESKQSTIARYDYGLNLQLYLNFHENLTFFNSIWGVSAFITINNSSYANDDSLDGIFLLPAMITDLTVYRTFKFTLPKPYSSCEVANDLPNTNIDSPADRLRPKVN